MTHPNIVKYYKTFLEGEEKSVPLMPSRKMTETLKKSCISGDKLYIVMELIEGVPLAEHFNSLKEKQQLFTEDRIWSLFIQVIDGVSFFPLDQSTECEWFSLSKVQHFNDFYN